MWCLHVLHYGVPSSCTGCNLTRGRKHLFKRQPRSNLSELSTCKFVSDSVGLSKDVPVISTTMLWASVTSDSQNTSKQSFLQLCMNELWSRKRATKLPHMKHEHADGKGDPLWSQWCLVLIPIKGNSCELVPCFLLRSWSTLTGCVWSKNWLSWSFGVSLLRSQEIPPRLKQLEWSESSGHKGSTFPPFRFNMNAPKRCNGNRTDNFTNLWLYNCAWRLTVEWSWMASIWDAY